MDCRVKPVARTVVVRLDRAIQYCSADVIEP
jgi:hypothetical protein